MTTLRRALLLSLWSTATLTLGLVSVGAYLARAVTIYWQAGWHRPERDLADLREWLGRP